MLHAHRKPRYFDSQDVPATEPCSKKMKSAEESFGKSYEGLQILHEEIHIKKTHSGFIPLPLSDDEAQEEKETTDIPFNKAFSGNKTVSSNPSDSIKNTEVRGSKCNLSTNNASVVPNTENSGLKHKNEGETELYSTSTAFIGPIYKSEADHQQNKRKTYTNSNCQKVSGRMTDGHPKKEVTPKDAPSCDVPKIEDELSQFYSEINQLENNDNCLDVHLQAPETNLNVQPVEYNKSNQIVCVDSREWSCRTSTNWGDGQCFYKEPTGHGTGSEPYTYKNSIRSRNGSGQCCNNERGVWEAEQLCNKKEDSRFWNDPMPQFKPSWQQTHQFIIPYGPPPPQFTTHFNLQETNSSPFHSHIFHSPNVGPFKNAHTNISSSTSDQSNAFVSHFGTHNMQTTRNGNNVPDGHVVNGFCETQGGWKDIKTCQNEESNIVSQQFPETKLCESQKLLLILRGLPGSGKTTLSHILLDHSRDGIVFSTDDYFRQNNGFWSYNIGLLGAAHDWNQKRAKQAMDQGRSPIIIDNTNTQAWEMKPYVEAALEKGYRVEFREPDTWWKFNPEELEKRNEHGVSREKIVQMLERYEYQMSIPIVMNSVLPFHKTSQRPPPQRRQRELVVKKKHRLDKMKQRRKRKRNRKIRTAAIKTVRKKSSSQLTSSEEDSSQSGCEDSEDNGKPVFVTGHPNEPKEGGEDGSANDNDVKLSKLKKGNFLLSSVVDPVTLSNSPDPDVLAGNSSLSVVSLPSVSHENKIERSFGDHLLNTAQSLNFVESSRNILEYNKQNSSLKLDHSDTDNSTSLTNIEDKDIPAKVVELGLESKELSDKKEVTILHHHGASQNTWAFFCFQSVDKTPYANSGKNECCLTWPEATSNIKYDQRPKKVRKSKQFFPETTAMLPDHESSKEFVKKENGKVLHEKNTMTGGAVPSHLTKDTQEMPHTIKDYFPTEFGTKGSVPSDITVLTTPRRNRRSKRIFKLAPKFDVPRQIPVRKDERMLKEVDELTKNEILNKETGEKNKGSPGCQECPIPSDVIVEFSHLNLEYRIYNDPSELAEQSPGSAANVVTAPIQMCPSVSCEALLPCGQQIEDANTKDKDDKVLTEVSTTQPDILCSVKELPECLTGTSAENIQQHDETGLTVYSQVRDDQDTLNSKFSYLRLPLSLGFAAQLVELFGSPGVSLDTLLPDDYVVPLEWATSKEIYLQWKTSMEKKQKNHILKEGSMTERAVDLEDSNKNEEERNKSSEINLKI